MYGFFFSNGVKTATIYCHAIKEMLKFQQLISTAVFSIEYWNAGPSPPVATHCWSSG